MHRTSLTSVIANARWTFFKIVDARKIPVQRLFVLASLVMLIGNPSHAGPGGACKEASVKTTNPSLRDACRIIEKHGIHAGNYEKYRSKCTETMAQVIPRERLQECKEPYTGLCRRFVSGYASGRIDRTHDLDRYLGVLNKDDAQCLLHHLWVEDWRARERLREKIVSRYKTWQAWQAVYSGGKTLCRDMGIQCIPEGEQALYNRHRGHGRQPRYTSHLPQPNEKSMSEILEPTSIGRYDWRGNTRWDLKAGFLALSEYAQTCSAIYEAVPETVKISLGRVDDICSAAAYASKIKADVTSVCENNAECITALENVAHDPSKYSIARCFTGDSTDGHKTRRGNDFCSDASAVLHNAGSEDSWETWLPLLNSKYLRSAMGITDDDVRGCVIGGGRFLGSPYDDCERVAIRLRSSAGPALRKGCNQGNLAVCRSLIEYAESKRHSMNDGYVPSTREKLKYWAASCEADPKWCSQYVMAVPRSISCFEQSFDHATQREVWADEHWLPQLTTIATDMKELCANSPSVEVAKEACQLVSDADLQQGVFIDCALQREERQIQLQKRRHNREKCLNEMGPKILAYHLTCAGLSYGTGDITDITCESQASTVCP